MGNVITREHAEKIVKKLKAVNESTSKSAHDTYVIYHEGIEIASFGVRRGSKKDNPHGHIPGELHIRPNQCVNLARCPLSREQWIDLLRERGLIPADANKSTEEKTVNDRIDDQDGVADETDPNDDPPTAQ